jgi:hypothetical protein
MPEKMEIAVYRVSGRSEISDLVLRQTETASKKPSQIVTELNGDSINLASKIEAEIRKSMPPYPPIMLQAEVRFYEGSLLMTATVMLLSWTGSIILDAVREELSSVIRVAVQRVMAGALTTYGPSGVGAMEITAVPEVARPPRLAPATVAQALIPSRLLTIAVFI